MSPAPAKSAWFDESTSAPVIAEQVQRLDSYLAAISDGVVDAGELQAQEARLVALMKEVEPLLDDALHAKVTRLLCELSAYDLMQVMHSMQTARPKTVFHG